MNSTETQPVPPEIKLGLIGVGLVDDSVDVRGLPLSGGVSSDIWRVDLATGPVCVKRALEQLRVESTWLAPTARTANEAAWLRAVAQVAPGAACRVLGFDSKTRVLALEWLDPSLFRNWKADLSSGHVDPMIATKVGQQLGDIHAAMADPTKFAEVFDADDMFRALRIEPYFETTAHAHPDLADTILDLANRTTSVRIGVVHGDISPKNILIGPEGPVFVDAECASWGDPAFDLAFCINHLLLKSQWHQRDSADLRRSISALSDAYLARVNWEQASELEFRVATLIPTLALARINGASPVEYLCEDDRQSVRNLARAMLIDQPVTIAEVVDRWHDAPDSRNR